MYTNTEFIVKHAFILGDIRRWKDDFIRQGDKKTAKIIDRFLNKLYYKRGAVIMGNEFANMPMRIIEAQICEKKGSAEIKAVILPSMVNKHQVLDCQVISANYEDLPDYNNVLTVVLSMALKHNIRKVLIDPYYDTNLLLSMQKAGIEIQPMRPIKADKLMKNDFLNMPEGRIEIRIRGLTKGAEIRAVNDCDILEVENIYTSQGSIIDYDNILKIVFGMALKFGIMEIWVDPWNNTSLIDSLKEIGLKIKDINLNKSNKPVESNPDEHIGELKELDEFKIERVDIKDGDTLVVQCPSRISNDAYNRLVKRAEWHFERKGLKNVTVLFLEEGAELKAILAPPKFTFKVRDGK